MRTNRHNLRSLLRFLENNFANKLSRSWDFEEGTVAVFTRDKLMLRNMQTLTVTVTIECRSHWNDVEISISASGGREGLFRIDFWAAENAAERWAEKEINKFLWRVDDGSQTTHRSSSTRPIE